MMWIIGLVFVGLFVLIPLGDEWQRREGRDG